jgi:hypothetical protein
MNRVTNPPLRRARNLDSLLVAVIFVILSLLTGRVFRSAFDDEIFSLDLIADAHGFMQLFNELLGAIDVHPPASYIFFYALARAGIGERGLHFANVLVSAAAAVVAHRILYLMLPENRVLAVPDRVVPIILLSSTPLLLSQGDAIRWYPLFALLFVSSLYAYLRARGGLAAALCGLLSSTNFLGFLVFPLLEVDRLSKNNWRMQWRPFASRAALFGIFALPGFITLWNGMTHDAHKYLAGQVGHNIFVAAFMTAIGFFGGNSLGLLQSAAALPIGVLAIYILYRSIRDPASRPLALNFAALFALLAIGFSKPRSFSYLALSLTVLLSYRWIVEANPKYRYLIGIIGLATPLAVVANIKWNETPYKRNAVLPVEEIVRFASYNAGQGDVIIVSDPVLYRNLHGSLSACVSLYLTNSGCKVDSAKKLIVIDGYGIGSEERDHWLQKKDLVLAKREELAAVFFGIDHEAAIKRRVIPGMGDYLLRASVYSERRGD